MSRNLKYEDLTGNERAEYDRRVASYRRVNDKWEERVGSSVPSGAFGSAISLGVFGGRKIKGHDVDVYVNELKEKYGCDDIDNESFSKSNPAYDAYHLTEEGKRETPRWVRWFS